MLNIYLSLFPDCKKWYDLFAGSCCLTLNHMKCTNETVNEANADIYDVLKVIQDEEFCRMFLDEIWEIKYSEEEFDRAKRELNNKGLKLDRVKRAVNMFIVITQSYNNLGQHYSEKYIKNYRITNYFNVKEAHKRLQGVKIRNEDALNILGEIKWDSEAFVFLDPPYLHKYRGKGADKAYGKFEMPEQKHREMLNLARDAECKIMICGYRNKDGTVELYDSILGDNENWRCYLLKDIHKPNKGRERAKEYIWVNYELPVYAKHYISMKDVMM